MTGPAKIFSRNKSSTFWLDPNGKAKALMKNSHMKTRAGTDGWMNGAMTEQEVEEDEQDNIIDAIFEDEND